MRTTILITSTLLGLHCYSQSGNNINYEEGIYKTETDYTNHHLTLAFNKNDTHHYKIKDPLLQHDLEISTPDTTYKFYYDDIWGYRDKGKDYRLYDNQAYQLIYNNGKICIYTIVDMTPEVNSAAEYFSTTLSSPIRVLSKKDLIEEYHADTAFADKIKQMPVTKSIFKWDHKQNIYEFVNWLE